MKLLPKLIAASKLINLSTRLWEKTNLNVGYVRSQLFIRILTIFIKIGEKSEKSFLSRMKFKENTKVEEKAYRKRIKLKWS